MPAASVLWEFDPERIQWLLTIAADAPPAATVLTAESGGLRGAARLRIVDGGVI